MWRGHSGGGIPPVLAEAAHSLPCEPQRMTVAHLLGHPSTQILPTYVRPLDEYTRAVIDALDTARKHHGLSPDSIN